MKNNFDSCSLIYEIRTIPADSYLGKIKLEIIILQDIILENKKSITNLKLKYKVETAVSFVHLKITGC